jgi:hypothetical protein
MAKENRDWGYDRIAGALRNLGYKVCDQTVGNVLQRHALPPAPERKRTTTWPAFIRTHLALLAGTDFLTAEVLTLRGLVTYYVLFFIHLESRRDASTAHPAEAGGFELCADLQQLKALPLPGFLAWPGGQKPLLFAPRVLAVAERSDIPVVLACGGVPPTRTFLFGPAWVTARPELKARIAAAATEMLSMRIIFSPMFGRTATTV